MLQINDSTLDSNLAVLPGQIEVQAVVGNRISDLPKYIRQGYTIAIEPFTTSLGQCAVIQDRRGNRVCILDTNSANVN